MASSGTGLTGYRLTGTDVNGMAGRRVQVVGIIVPPSGANSSTPGTMATPEFRVQSVQPVAGNCP